MKLRQWMLLGGLALLVMNLETALTVNWSIIPPGSFWERTAPGGGQVAFIQMGPGSDPTGGDVYLLDTASGKIVQLTLGSQVDRIAWELDGNHLDLHFGGDSGRPYTQALDVRTGLVSSLADRTTIDPDLRPDLSPDGTQVVYADLPGNDDSASIWVARPDGSWAKKIGTGSGPRWSPDGRRIVFSKKRPGDADSEIYTMAADGGDIRRVLAHPGDDITPDWSAVQGFSGGGSRIAFSTLTWGVNNSAFMGSVFYTVDVDGGNLKKIIESSSTNPELFMADGKRIFMEELNSVCAVSGEVGTGACYVASGGDLSPDGRDLAWAQDDGRHGSMLCFMVPPGSENPMPEACDYSTPTRMRSVRWRPISPDTGWWIAYGILRMVDSR